MSAKTVTLIAFLLIVAGFSGFGLAEIMPNNTNSEENLDNFSEKNVFTEFSRGIFATPSSSTVINP